MLGRLAARRIQQRGCVGLSRAPKFRSLGLDALDQAGDLPLALVRLLASLLEEPLPLDLCSAEQHGSLLASVGDDRPRLLGGLLEHLPGTLPRLLDLGSQLLGVAAQLLSLGTHPLGVGTVTSSCSLRLADEVRRVGGLLLGLELKLLSNGLSPEENGRGR